MRFIFFRTRIKLIAQRVGKGKKDARARAVVRRKIILKKILNTKFCKTKVDKSFLLICPFYFPGRGGEKKVSPTQFFFPRGEKRKL